MRTGTGSGTTRIAGTGAIPTAYITGPENLSSLGETEAVTHMLHLGRQWGVQQQRVTGSRRWRPRGCSPTECDSGGADLLPATRALPRARGHEASDD